MASLKVTNLKQDLHTGLQGELDNPLQSAADEPNHCRAKAEN